MTEPATRPATGGLSSFAIAGVVAVMCAGLARPAAPPAGNADRAFLARDRRIPPSLWWAIASHRNTPETWDVAAAVYTARVWRCTAELPVGEHGACVAPAFAAAIAARNALAAETLVSRPARRQAGFPTRAQTLDDAANNVAVLAFPDDGGWLMNEFRLAAQLWSCRHELALWGADVLSRDPLAQACVEQHLDWASSLHREMRDPRFVAGNDDLFALGLEPP